MAKSGQPALDSAEESALAPLIESLEEAWFGPSPGTSCHTHDSARSLHLAGRSKAPRLSLERLARTLHTAGPKRGSADSLASTAHSLGSAESLPGRSASLLAAEEAAAAEALRLEEVTTPRGIGLSTSLVSPRPRHSSEEDEAQAFDPSSLPGLGTWAQRQFHFQPRADSPQAELAGTPTLAVPQPSRGASRRCTQDEDDAVAAAAWRWRFNRRWANEQAKQWDPEQTRRSLDGDAWDDALEMLGACGPAGRTHLAHTVSTENELATPRPISPRSSNLSMLGCMLGESQPEPEPLAEADTDSTRKAAALARKAHSLFRQQLRIEQQVEERWSSAAAQGTAWVGKHLQTVLVDSYGRFDFVLIRLSERKGPAKLVVRGARDSTPATLQQALHQQAEHVRRERGMPPVLLTLLGAGCMEWLGERQDTVNLRCTEAAKGVEGALDSRQDVARVTGSLMRSALPLHQKLHVHVL